ncbi:hypothetical protein KP509_25G022100 [Ceratopteris richardii]|uniref:Uncharacterized protein n=1 Tax=Ceratopteris richardii TaxID=49495 RepID=A0A8T2RQB5_CERRI|nr:hypothetical protein KP509_25G022100 [Ceratopteris richardii]KAH7297988.1 hypothetical protein KP509_25G022100 [Ceratopteris richardii]
MTRGKHSSGYDDYEDYDDGYDDYYDDFDEDYPKPSSASKLPTSERKTLTQKATPKNKLWSCTVCTFENIEGAAVCDICGTSRFQASTQFPFNFDTPSPDDLVLSRKRAPIKSSPAKPSNESSAKKVISGEKGSTVKQKASHEEKDLNTSSKDTQVNLDSMEMLNQATEKLKGVDIKTETEKGKHRREPCPPLDTYEPEEWMLETFKQESKQLLHLAIVGHVDAGKSTLMGRLLHILGQVSKKEMHKYEREAKQSGKGSFSYAWVLDESSEERARGITMTVAVAQFETPKFHIVVLDSPGHKDFVPNMISGASQADAAVLVIDACTGAFEAGMEGEGQGVGQTKEHTQLVRSFGVEQLVVAVNKMDAVEYSEDRFNAIKTSLRPFLKHCGFKESGIRWIPLSAMENENLVTQPVNGQMLWYRGPTLLQALDSLEPPVRNVAKPFRLPIAEIFKSRTLGQAVVSGKVEGGAVKIGSKVLVMPSGVSATVKGIEQNGKTCTFVRAGDNADVGLQGVDPACLLQGGVLCHPDYPLPAASLLEVKVLLLETSGPLLRGSQVIIHCHHAKEPAKITKLVSLLDQKGQAIPNKKLRCLLANQRAVIEVKPERGICLEEYSRYKALGRISLRDAGKTLAVGIVTRIIEYE